MSATRSRRHRPQGCSSARSRRSLRISRPGSSAKARLRLPIARNISVKVPCAARRWPPAGNSRGPSGGEGGQLAAFLYEASATSKSLIRAANGVLGAAAGGFIAALLSSPLTAAEVTFDRLKNAESEPGNWLTNHKTYDARRFSTLDQINQANIKNLHVAFVVQLGGAEPGGDKPHGKQQATPLAEDGMLYTA